MTDLPEEDVGWILRRSAEGAPITKTLGMEPLSYDRESGVFRMAFQARPEFCNILGTIQGGILTAMLDTAMSYAGLAKLGPKFRVPSLEFKTTYIAPAYPGRLVGEGRPIRLGKTVGFLEGNLYNADDQLLAISSGTCQVRPIDR